MLLQKNRIKPTHYPTVVFHSIRAFQCLSSMIVGSIMVYFVHELIHARYALPWTFILVLQRPASLPMTSAKA